MNNPWPALLFGALLLVTGGGMLYAQRRAWRLAGEISNLEERTFLQRRCRRRVQMAGMILLIGIMIPLGDLLFTLEYAPQTFAVYWLIVIGLAVWTGLLAVGDMAATRAHMANELNRLHRHRLELHRVAQKARKLHRDKPLE